MINQRGFTLWLTGLPSAGKTTLAHLIGKTLREQGIGRIEILDGDVIRTNLCKDLGFTHQDRDTNIRRIAFVCGLLTRHDVIPIVAAISPYRESRDFARKQIDRFVEVYVKCPLDIAIQRDVKGLYRKALNGEIPAFTGVSDPYEEPLNPEIVVETNTEPPDRSAHRIIQRLVEQGWLNKSGGGL
jgi:adenylylsulfate kinase